MTDDTNTDRQHIAEDVVRQAEQRSHGLAREFIDFLRYNKKWWLLPIILVLLVVGLFVTLGSTVFAPLIYTLF